MRLTHNAQEICDIAQRIRARSSVIVCHGRPIQISLGIAICDRTIASPHALIEKADQALYEAKARGKNQIVLGPVA